MRERLGPRQLEYVQDCRRFAPHLLEVIEVAKLRGEDVDDDVSEVNKKPARIGSPFNVIRLDANVACLIANAVHQSGHVTVARRRADDEVIGEIGCLSNVQDDDVFRFRFGRPIGDLPC